MKTLRYLTSTICVPILLVTSGAPVFSAPARTTDLWELARQQERVHRFSTLFTAQDVRGRLSSGDGLTQAIDWCQRTAVTQV